MLEHAKPQSLPDNKSEVQKTIVATLDSGAGEFFIDNLPDDGKVDFGELASAISAWPTYLGRRLGVNEMVEAVVKVVWKGTGNRTSLSEELAQRTLLIDLDPQMENPGERPDTMFAYDLDSYLPEHAGRYLNALLTLVQHWKAEGCPEWGGNCLGGFEQHNKIIGGILDAAGIRGFLGNRDKLKAVVQVENPESKLLDALIEKNLEKPTVFRVGGADAVPKTTGIRGRYSAPCPVASKVPQTRPDLSHVRFVWPTM